MRHITFPDLGSLLILGIAVSIPICSTRTLPVAEHVAGLWGDRMFMFTLGSAEMRTELNSRLNPTNQPEIRRSTKLLGIVLCFSQLPFSLL